MDAGPLYAYVDASDRHHVESVDLLRTHPGPLVVPMLVIAEAVHFIGTRLGAHVETRFLGDLASGVFAIEPVVPSDWMRIAELVYRYRELRIGTVDASVVAAAERLSITTVATFDRRDFGTVIPSHCPAFELIP